MITRRLCRKKLRSFIKTIHTKFELLDDFHVSGIRSGKPVTKLDTSIEVRLIWKCDRLFCGISGLSCENYQSRAQFSANSIRKGSNARTGNVVFVVERFLPNWSFVVETLMERLWPVRLKESWFDSRGWSCLNAVNFNFGQGDFYWKNPTPKSFLVRTIILGKYS